MNLLVLPVGVERGRPGPPWLLMFRVRIPVLKV
jgi:hypothetical protein